MTELHNKAVNKFESLGSILESKSTTHPEIGGGRGGSNRRRVIGMLNSVV